jgi:hypothetical protein
VSEEKFIDLFRLVEPELQAQLRSRTNGTIGDRLKRTSTAVGHALEQVGRHYHSSVGDTDRRTADVKRQHADALLAAIARGFECLGAVSVTTTARRGEPSDEVSHFGSWRGSALAWAGLAAVVAIVGVAAIAVSGLAALIGLAAALSTMVAAGGVKWEFAHKRGRALIEPTSRGVPYVSCSIDERRVCNAVADALLEGDEVTVQLQRLSRAGEPPSAAWTEDQAILLTVQGLLGADLQQDSVELRLRVRELRSALLRRGISVVAFDGSNDDLFDFERAYRSDVSEPTTLVPALTSDGRPLARGRAIRPNTRPRMEGALK